MSLILSGTDGLSDVDGSAATPAIRGTDANTGIFFPAADTIAFSEGGVEAMRIDSIGNVGIGTSSPGTRLQLGNNSNASELARFANTLANFDVGVTAGGCQLYTGNNQPIVFSNNAAERMRIDSSGNVGIGTVSPAVKLQVNGSISLATSNNLTWGGIYGAGIPTITADGTNGLQFYPTGSTSGEKVRINSSGNLLVGKTVGSAAGNGVVIDPFGSTIATIDSSNTYHVYSSANSTFRFYVNVNGGISNFSANNVNLSDERVKKNIELSGGYLAKICAIPVKLFNYKDEAEGEQRTLGVIAQDVESVAPELVNNDGWVGEEPEDGVPLKTIYQTDLQYALMKCIQEQQALITTLTDRITALETPTGTQA
jgi:hypothetical protein